MLYRFSQFMSGANSKMHKRQRGVVLDNKDPLKLGRVKMSIPGIFNESDKENLPWIHPHSSHELNGHEKMSNIYIPRIGASLSVEFHGGSVYHPFYTGTYRSQNNVAMKPFEDGYPDKFGTVHPDGTSNVHDLKNHTSTYSHYAVDDDQSSDDLDEGDNGTGSGSGTAFSTKRSLKASEGNGDGDPEQSQAQPVMQHIIDKLGSVTTTSQKDLTTNFQGNSAHTVGGDKTESVTGGTTMSSVKDMVLNTAQNMLHKAGSDILHQATSDIKNVASKILLN